MSSENKEFNVLVVEDSPAMRQLLSFILKRIKRVNVVEATNGVDALKRMSVNRFDLVITDINMPIMDGLKLVNLIRKDDIHKNVPIIIVTTEGAQEDKERAMALGANAYITKPIQSSYVIEIVKQYLK